MKADRAVEWDYRLYLDILEMKGMMKRLEEKVEASTQYIIPKTLKVSIFAISNEGLKVMWMTGHFQRVCCSSNPVSFNCSICAER
jgi:hypothetical protein